MRIVDEETTAQILLIGCCFYVGRAEDCAWRAGAARKNAIRVSLQNRNWIERTFMSMTLLFG